MSTNTRGNLVPFIWDPWLPDRRTRSQSTVASEHGDVSHRLDVALFAFLTAPELIGLRLARSATTYLLGSIAQCKPARRPVRRSTRRGKMRILAIVLGGVYLHLTPFTAAPKLNALK